MGHADTVDLLLRHDADINAKDRNQYTPLHVAAASGKQFSKDAYSIYTYINTIYAVRF